MKTSVLLAGVGLLLGITAIQAQPPGSSAPSTMHRTRAFIDGGSYSGDYAYHAATIPESIDNGIANLLDARGRALKHQAEAALTWSEAQRRLTENWKKAIETSFEVRRINSEARLAERGRPLSPADYLRLAQMDKPRRLTPSEVNILTGELAWPLALQTETFTAERDVLDQVFADRAEHGSLAGDAYFKARQATQAMLDTLREQIEQLAPNDYMAARRFIEGLAVEARIPTAATETVRAAMIQPRVR